MYGALLGIRKRLGEKAFPLIGALSSGILLIPRSLSAPGLRDGVWSAVSYSVSAAARCLAHYLSRCRLRRPNALRAHSLSISQFE